MITTILKYVKNIFADGDLIKYAKAKAVYSQERGYFLCDITFTLTYAHAFIDFF